MNNIPALLCVDSYKLGHADQYPESTQFVYSNFTPRSLKHFAVPEAFANNTIVAYGMYAAVKEIADAFDETFFRRSWVDVEHEISTIYPSFLGAKEINYARLYELYLHGRLPLTIRALPEGAHVTPQIPVLTIENTAPEFFWVTNFIETWLSNTLWKPMTSATISWNYRQILDHYADKTGTDPAFVDWQGHDFSLRGMSGIEDGARTGVGHLLSFTGSDNLAATWYTHELYDIAEGELVAGSVPATEHSVMSCGSQLNELDTFKRLIEEVYPSGIVSIVSDTWNFWDVVTTFANALKDKILLRDGKVVFRPDSGDPADILCGTAWGYNPRKGEFLSTLPEGVYVNVLDGSYQEVIGNSAFMIEDPTPAMKGAVQCLWDIFGGTLTTTGHKLLNQHVGLIYGDSITMERAVDILDRLERKNFASGNVVLGIGSYTFQYVTRDTLGAAMKATYAVVDGKNHVLSKDPITDPGKKSAAGLLRVDLVDEEYVLTAGVNDRSNDALVCILKDGLMVDRKPKLREIRERVKYGQN